MNIEKVHTSKKCYSITCALEVELNSIPFLIKADGNRAVISFTSLSDAYAFFKTFSKYKKINRSQLDKAKIFLKQNGLTICLQKKYVRVLGPEANSFLARLLRL